MAYVNLELTAEAVADAMLEDGVFAEELWTEIADRLAAGRMRDDLCDIVSQMPDREAAQMIARQISETADLIKNRI